MHHLNKTSNYLLAVLFSGFLLNPAYGKQGLILHDFSSARIVTTDQLSQTEQAAVEMLQEEIKSRINISLQATSDWPDSSVPVIVVGTKSALADNYGSFDRKNIIIRDPSDDEPEGFTISFVDSVRQAPTLFILGNDKRGILFGVGYFLRKVFMKSVMGNSFGKLLVPSTLHIATYPKLPLRGHQLGYRPKTNAYDGLTAKMWEQYIRDLIVFGTNAIELVPPNTDDVDESPMFTRPQMDMMVKMDKILKKYDLNAWIWYPMMYGDYSKSENVKKSLAENESIFKKLPKIDAIFVPGGDPGHTPPKLMFSYMEKEAKLLHQYHPDAELWMSPQGFSQQLLQEFYQLIQNKPPWLAGIVYGPQLKMTLAQLRSQVPDRYPIRRYPDITHNLDSQYPVSNWDYAYAATENRESINPRPRKEAMIFGSVDPSDYYGFISYSEGLNDDVNKMIWSGLGWNPQARVGSILRDYSRYFLGPSYSDDFAQGLLDLEENWEGPLMGNNVVYTTLGKFQAMEKEASPRQRLNWRFQQALYRAYYDAYDRSRLIYETSLEDQAMVILRQAPRIGSRRAIARASEILDRAVTTPVSQEWRQRVFELAEALFQSIHMQKSVERYYGEAIRRGANLDLIDYWLNDRLWLKKQFERIGQLKDEQERLDHIDSLVNWENPGPGGFYDDLGNLGHQPHLVKGKPYAEDPHFLSSAFSGFLTGKKAKKWGILRVSWLRYAQTRYDHPLTMHYGRLDSTAQYVVKVTYTGENFYPKIRLIAEGKLVHPYIKKPLPIKPVQYNVPKKATRDGSLDLQWNIEQGIGGDGHGCEIAEVWLMKKKNKDQ